MFDLSPIGKLFIVLGIVFLAVGLFFTLGNKIPFLGKLPGDIAIQRKGFSFYFPLTTCIIISVILSLIMWILSRK